MEDNADDKEFFKFTIYTTGSNLFRLFVKNDKAYKGTENTEENRTYNWIIDWGDGSELEEKTIITPTPEGYITHTYPTSGFHQITIRPKNPKEKGWMKCFGAGYVSSPYQQLYWGDISLDSPLTKNALFDDGDNHYVGYRMFLSNANLTMGPEFNLPQDLDITKVGDYFCSEMFANWNGNTSQEANMNDIFNLPQGIIEVGENFCYSMFRHIQRWFKFNKAIQLPQGITKVKENFCKQMFYQSEGINTGAIQFFGNIKLPQEELDKEGVFFETFYGCIGINEEISADIIPQLEIIPSKNNNCFGELFYTENCPKNWGGMKS